MHVPTKDKKTGRVEDLYQDILDQVVTFALRPGSRINEVHLAEQLGASRTPLREALNRLAAQRLISFEPGKGFFCRDIQPRKIRELYQARAAVECYVVERVCDSATDRDLDQLSSFLDEIEPKTLDCSSAALLNFDEQFHHNLAQASGNEELVSMLDNLSARIRYVRWVQMDQPDARQTGRHRALLTPILARDPISARAAMEAHIETRVEQITDAVAKAHVRIFVEQDEPQLSNILRIK
jgi:DNA-binding GntR family transcriptional regulator